MRELKGFGRPYHHILMNEIKKKDALCNKYIYNISNNGALRSEFAVRNYHNKLNKQNNSKLTLRLIINLNSIFNFIDQDKNYFRIIFHSCKVVIIMCLI